MDKTVMAKDEEFNIIKRELVERITSLEKTQAECARVEGEQIDRLTRDISKLEAAIDRFSLELDHRHEQTETFRHEIRNKLAPLQLIIGTEERPGHSERIRGLEKQVKQIYAVWLAIGLFAANTARDWWLKIHGG